MARCETCGMYYDRSFEVVLEGRRHFFDCFECAIQALAPRCGNCACRIIGQGVEVDDSYYCCDRCASEAQCKTHWSAAARKFYEQNAQ